MEKITDKIYWMGIKDWNLRHFHGQELSTHRGTTYNSYLIKDQKTVLVDTAWPPHGQAYMKKINALGADQIDYIIVNHMEPDHGGMLADVIKENPSITLFCTQKGKEIIHSYFPESVNWDIQTVKTKDTLDIGENTITFVEMKMIHWPDSMMIYLDKEKTVLSNDAFGQHYCSKSLFNDEVDTHELFGEAIKYYANIVAPFSSLVKKKIQEVIELDLDIEMIAPSHGIIWRDDPMQIIQKYQEWADQYSEDYAVIAYDTMYESTKRMAEKIEEGIRSQGKLAKLFNSALTDTSDLITELFKAKAYAIGSCTVNNASMASIHTLTHEIKAHKFTSKPFIAFGSYGWSGEAPKEIDQLLTQAKHQSIGEPIKAKYLPNKEELDRCFEMGVELAKKM